MTNSMREWQAEGVKNIEVTAIGNRGYGFMQRMGAKVVSHLVHIGDTPHLDKLVGPVKVMIDKYLAGEVDVAYIAYT